MLLLPLNLDCFLRDPSVPVSGCPLQWGNFTPDLNPQGGIWSLVKRDIGNLAAANLDQLTRAVKRKLKMIQYRAHLIDGCLTGTGLIMNG